MGPLMMNDISKASFKPIWYEGMLLSQQHFQQWEQHLQSHIYQSLQLPYAADYGLRVCDLDLSSLHRGCLRVKTLCGVFAAGVAFYFDDAIHEPLEITFDPGCEGWVHLALPRRDAVEGLPGYASCGLVRSCAKTLPISDAYDPGRVREVIVAKPNYTLRFLAEGQHGEAENEMLMPILHVGACEKKPAIPPLLCLGASPWLLEQLQQLKEQLHQKLMSIESEEGQHRWERKVLASLWMELTVLDKNQHPGSLYKMLLEKLAYLMPCDAFVASDWRYRPTQLAECFDRVFKRLSDIACTLPASTTVLHQGSECLWSVRGCMAKKSLTKSLYLSIELNGLVRADVLALEASIKVGAPSRMDSILSGQEKGLNLSLLSTIPSAQEGSVEYFQIHPEGFAWQQILQEDALAVYLPEYFSRCRLALDAR